MYIHTLVYIYIYIYIHIGARLGEAMEGALSQITKDSKAARPREDP